MKTIAVHSHMGGVGKTTVSLLLAKFAAGHDESVCVVDFDFFGAGMSDLIQIRTLAGKYLDDYLLSTNPNDLKVDDIMSDYSDGDIESNKISLILNMYKGLANGGEKGKIIEHQRDIQDMIADEPHYNEIRLKTDILIGKLKDGGVKLAIFDCHPGICFVSDSIRDIVDLNVYVTTPNRSDCFGLLKSVDLWKLDDEQSFLVLNRMDDKNSFSDPAGFFDMLGSDGIIGNEANTLSGQLKYFGKTERNFAAIPRSDVFRRFGDIGSEGILPKIEPKQIEFDFCQRIYSLLQEEENS